MTTVAALTVVQRSGQPYIARKTAHIDKDFALILLKVSGL